VSGELRYRLSGLERRRANVAVGVAALIAVAVLILLGVQLSGSQKSARQSVLARFADRAQVISALTQAVLSSAAGSDEASRQYGAGTVSGRVLDRTVAQGHLAYAVLLDQDGRVVAASSALTPADRAQMLSSAALKPVLAGAPVSLSDVLSSGAGRAGVIDLAVSLKTAASRQRCLVRSLAAICGGFRHRVARRTCSTVAEAWSGPAIRAEPSVSASWTPV
jgi:hypothetical protein